MISTINFKFEHCQYDDKKSFQTNLYTGNISNFKDKNFCRFSQVVESMFVFNQATNISHEVLNPISLDDFVEHYIISTAVYYSNNDWATDNSVFEMLNPRYLEDLQKGKALLLMDQSVEGYQSDWLWDWFYDKCSQHNIDPRAIIYLTGNQLCQEQYKENEIKVIPSTSLSFYIYQTYRRNHLDINFDDIINYKKNNLSEISLFDCTNLRVIARHQRIFNFLHLLNSNLINDGKISMPDKKTWPAINEQDFKKYKLPLDILDKVKTPLTINHKNSSNTQYHEFITRILDDVYRTTWVSLITESSYFEKELSVFISEKTFKPIACMQPFIIVGSKHTLKYLRKLGYKTFDGFIDESYDDLEDDERFLAIVNALEKIKNIQNKISWYESMRDILEHNHRLFLSIGTTQSYEHAEIVKYYQNYFKI